MFLIHDSGTAGRRLGAALVSTALLCGRDDGCSRARPMPRTRRRRPSPPTTVTADALPTWQINGVVWSQVVVGTTVYVTGSFTKARPPGVAVGGAGEVDALNIFAYDLTTGNRVASFNHALNAQGLAIAASPDGSRVYVGGDFTTVDGTRATATSPRSPPLTARCCRGTPPSAARSARWPSPTRTVYAGGSFPTAGAQPRASLAAFSPATTTQATLRPGPPPPAAATRSVLAMVLAPDGSRVILGGSFETLVGRRGIRHGLGRRRPPARSCPWAANTKIRTAGLQRRHHEPEHRRHAGLRHRLRVRRRRRLRGHLRGRPLDRRHQLGQRLPR